MNHRIIPKPESPYATLDFPDGIPVIHPIPTGLKGAHLLWDLDLNRISDEQLLSIAKIAIDNQKIDVEPTVMAACIKNHGSFGLWHGFVDRLVGSDSSADELEGMGRAFRVRYSLMRTNPILAKLTIDDAIVMFVETKYANGGLDSEDSPSSEMVDLWLPVIVCEVKKRSPNIAKILLKDELVPADLAPVMSEDYFDTIADIEIELPIPAYTAYLLCAILQVRLKDPDCAVAEPIRHYIRMLESAIVQLCPEARWMLERNWHPEFDGGAG